MRHNMDINQSKDHNIESFKVNKSSLSSYSYKKICT